LRLSKSRQVLLLPVAQVRVGRVLESDHIHVLVGKIGALGKGVHGGRRAPGPDGGHQVDAPDVRDFLPGISIQPRFSPEQRHNRVARPPLLQFNQPGFQALAQDFRAKPCVSAAREEDHRRIRLMRHGNPSYTVDRTLPQAIRGQFPRKSRLLYRNIMA
jgi:hypothetical protein